MGYLIDSSPSGRLLELWPRESIVYCILVLLYVLDNVFILFLEL
jgi:hypothetical protein